MLVFIGLLLVTLVISGLVMSWLEGSLSYINYAFRDTKAGFVLYLVDTLIAGLVTLILGLK